MKKWTEPQIPTLLTSIVTRLNKILSKIIVLRSSLVYIVPLKLIGYSKILLVIRRE